MRRSTGDRGKALACAAVALLLGLTGVIAVIAPQDWNVTALVRMEDKDPMSRIALETDPDFVVYDVGHYDGVYYYAIARDPLARGPEGHAIDLAAYRYAHAGYGWLGWLFSFGQAGLAPWALLLVALAGVAVAAGLGSTIASLLGLSPWLGLAVALNPGLIFSVTTLTSEPAGAALLMLTLLFWIKRRWLLAGICLTMLCLVKEWFVTVPVALAFFEFIRSDPRRAGRARWFALAAGPIVFIIWYLYLSVHFGVGPASQGSVNIDLPPLDGWIDALGRATNLGLGSSPEASQLGFAAIPLLVSAGALLLLGVFVALRLRTLFDPMFILIALFVLSGSWLTILFPKDLLRTMTIPLVLLPFVLARRRASARSPL